MAYTSFTLSDLHDQFGITNQVVSLFDGQEIEPQKFSIFLEKQLEEASELSIKSEKARSELIVLPVLMEARRLTNKFFTIYSGDQLHVDKEKGLTGECDFILSKATNSFDINLPLLCVVEAKKQDMELGIQQCAAQMLGSFLFNKKKKQPIDQVYGCVTTADAWKFMRLHEGCVAIDTRTYYKNEIDRILGVFCFIIRYYQGIFKSTS